MVNSLIHKEIDIANLIEESSKVENPALERAIKKMENLGEHTGEKITSYDRMHHRATS